MSREILFRGKHVHTLLQNGHLDGTWVYGYLCDKNYINTADEDEYGGKFISEMLIDPETVCQYTGLTDRTKWKELSENEKEKFLSKRNYKENRQNTKEDWNGRKIFEGDIVDSDGDIGIVKFGKYKNGFHFGYYIEWNKRPFLRQELGYWNRISKVIGNIFDNPELINGGKEK